MSSEQSVDLVKMMVVRLRRLARHLEKVKIPQETLKQYQKVSDQVDEMIEATPKVLGLRQLRYWAARRGINTIHLSKAELLKIYNQYEEPDESEPVDESAEQSADDQSSQKTVTD